MVDILKFIADKDEFTTENIVSHFGFNPTTAKRYLRQLTEFGYLEALGGIRTGLTGKNERHKGIYQGRQARARGRERDD